MNKKTTGAFISHYYMKRLKRALALHTKLYSHHQYNQLIKPCQAACLSYFFSALSLVPLNKVRNKWSIQTIEKRHVIFRFINGNCKFF